MDETRTKSAGKRKLPKGLVELLLAAAFMTGLCVLLYPAVSDLWNTRVSSGVIHDYSAAVEADKDGYAAEWKEAADYNAALASRDTSRFLMTDEERAHYMSMLAIEGTSAMGSIEIPCIGVNVPIYHGTGEEVLAAGAGHMEGSSLPVGGRSTHCVITGHRGLPSARLFTDLDELAEGDVFFISVLGQRLAYQVEALSTVLPEEMDGLAIAEGEDTCTLVTCTPYGVNTHRLLVRGRRVEYDADTERVVIVTADAVKTDTMLVAAALVLPSVFVLFVWLLVRSGCSVHSGRSVRSVRSGRSGRDGKVRE